MVCHLALYSAHLLCVCRIEGVFYRIGQKLEKYRLEPVAHSIDDHIANSKVYLYSICKYRTEYSTLVQCTYIILHVAL